MPTPRSSVRTARGSTCRPRWAARSRRSGTLLLLSSLVSAAVGAVGYQTGVEGRDLSVAGLVGGLLSLFLACLVGGWVAGRMARRKGGLHGLIAALWLVLLARCWRAWQPSPVTGST
jgi:putative membrane protein (TIGR04086 family)